MSQSESESDGAEVRAVAARAQEAATELAPLSRGIKDAALRAMADAVVAATDEILAANGADIARARQDDTPEQLIDRLSLTADRVQAMAEARSLAPVGQGFAGASR